MTDFRDLLPEYEDQAPIWYGFVAENAVDHVTPVPVIIPEFDEHLQWGPCRWQARDGQLPSQGDACVLAFDNRRELWVVAWWPATYTGGGGGVQNAWWRWDTSTSGSVGAGHFGLNAVTWATTTQLRISETTDPGTDVSSGMDSIGSGDSIYVQQQDDSTRWARFSVTGAPTDLGTYRTIPVTYQDSGAMPSTNNTPLLVQFGGAGGGGGGTVPDATPTVKGILQLAGDLSGTAASPQIAAGAIVDADVAAANKDGTVATPSLRTLGTGAQQAAAGNDSRFTDARVPTAHHTTHEPGGSDPMAVDAAAATGSLRTLGTGPTQAAVGGSGLPTGGTAGQQLTKLSSTNYASQWSTPMSTMSGTLAARPAAGAVTAQSTYYATDTAQIFISDGISTWTLVAKSIPTGGTTGQVLSKVDGTDYNVSWSDTNVATAVILAPASDTRNRISRTAGGYGLSIQVTADTADRLRLKADGTVEWGDGTATPDTNLYRKAADTLASDDNFNQYNAGGDANPAIALDKAAGGAGKPGLRLGGGGATATDASVWRQAAANIYTNAAWRFTTGSIALNDSTAVVTIVVSGAGAGVAFSKGITVPTGQYVGAAGAGGLQFGTDVGMGRTAADVLEMAAGDTFKASAAGITFSDNTVQTTAAVGGGITADWAFFMGG